MTIPVTIGQGSSTPSWTVTLDDAPVAVSLGAGGAGCEPLVAIGGADGLLSIRSIEGAERHRAVVPGGLLTLAWSPDGSILAAGGPSGAFAWTATAGLTALGTTGWCSAVVWSQAGRLAVADGTAATVFEPLPSEWPDVAEIRQSWRTPDVASTVTALLWLRLGRELALAAYGGLLAFAPGRSTPQRELRYAGSLLAAAASPDGRWLVSGNQDASIHVWRRRDGAELEMAGLARKVTLVEFDASGRWLAANGSPDSTVWDFSGRGPGGTSPRLLELHPRGATALAWHPDLPVLATGGADGVLALWDVPRATPGRPVAAFWSAQAAPGAVSAVAWSPDGSLLVAAVGGGVVAYPVPALPARA